MGGLLGIVRAAWGWCGMVRVDILLWMHPGGLTEDGICCRITMCYEYSFFNHVVMVMFRSHYNEVLDYVDIACKS